MHAVLGGIWRKKIGGRPVGMCARAATTAIPALATISEIELLALVERVLAQSCAAQVEQ